MQLDAAEWESRQQEEGVTLRWPQPGRFATAVPWVAEGAGYFGERMRKN